MSGRITESFGTPPGAKKRTPSYLVATFALQAILAVVIAGVLYRISHTAKPPLESERQNVTRLAWIDNSGRPVRSYDLRGRYILPRLSPGGDAVLLTQVMPGDAAVWSLSLTTGKLSLLVSPGRGKRSAFAIVSMDGRSLVWSQWHENRASSMLAALDHAGAGRPLLKDVSLQKGFSITPDDWASDGDRVILTRRNMMKTDLLIVQAHDGTAYPVLDLPKDVHAFDARISPDGKWIAFTSDMNGIDEVYRAQVPAQLTSLPLRAADLTRVSDHGGCSPEWGFNGDILYLSPGGNLVATNWTERSPSARGTHFVLDMSSLGTSGFGYRFGGYAVDRAHGLILAPMDNVKN